MKRGWFKKYGWFKFPVSWQGWLVTLFFIASSVWVFIVVDRNSHSASDTLIGVFPWVIIFIVIASWIASNTEKK